MINKKCETNRFNLWNYFRSKNIITLPNTQEKYEDWKSRKFGKNDDASIEYFNTIIQPNYTSLKDWSVDDFFKGYVCDLRPDSDYCKAAAHPTDDTVVPNTGNTTGNTATTTGSTATTTGSTATETNITADDLKNGKWVNKGMKGDIVGKIQQLLIDKGYKNISKSGKVDNIFGSRTKASVVEFQRNNHIKDDGAVGSETWPKLNDPKAKVKDNTVATATAAPDNNSGKNDLQGKGDTYVNGSDAKINEKDMPDVLKESIKKILRESLLKHQK